MGFVKRAMLYCIRQRFKTLLLFLVLTLLATSMLSGIAIGDAAQGATVDFQRAVGGKIELNLDMEGHMGAGQKNEWGTAYSYNGDMITQEIVDAIKKVDGVVDYNVEETEGYFGAGVDFKYLPASLGISYTPYGEASSYTVTLSSEKCKAFQGGKYRLVDGRHIGPEDKYACLLSKELADYNQLSVGDRVTMYSLDSDSKTSFEVVGIFDGTEGASENALQVGDIPSNCGYVAYSGIEEIFKDFEGEDGYQQLTIFVEDPAGIQNVYDRVSALPELKGKSLKLAIDTDEYDVVSAPLESLQELVNIGMAIISVVSIVIVTLLLTIWARGRKKEMGILLSLGKGKADIMLQIFMETISVGAVSFGASIPISFLVAQKAGMFLASRVAAGKARIHVEVDAACLLPLSLIGILIIAVSVIASSWTVVRLKPKDTMLGEGGC